MEKAKGIVIQYGNLLKASSEEKNNGNTTLVSLLLKSKRSLDDKRLALSFRMETYWKPVAKKEIKGPSWMTLRKNYHSGEFAPQDYGKICYKLVVEKTNDIVIQDENLLEASSEESKKYRRLNEFTDYK